MAKPRVAAIIQARMGSTRLPGKVLMPLAGKPVLWHIIHRLRKCRMVDVVAIATSDQPCDDPLVEFARNEGVELVRGPEDNVLQRFALTAAKLDPDYIVRVTGDAPLIDPETIDLLVREMITKNADYCLGESQRPTIHEGFDPFSRRALDKLLEDASDDPVAREHVTAYLKIHPAFVHTIQVKLPFGFEIDGVRASVDTPSDLLFLESLYKRLGSSPGEIDLREAVSLLNREPELKHINSHVRQKDAAHHYGRMLIRCDGSPRLGLGHVVRCLALAEELRDGHGIGICFALGEEGVGAELVRRLNFPVDIRPQDTGEEEWIDALIRRFDPRALILDIRTDLDRPALSRWRKAEIALIVIDDPTDRRLEADLAVYPPVPQIFEADWSGFAGRACIGWEYILLRREFRWRTPRPHNDPPVVLVTMGGSDPAGLTLLALDALRQLETPFRAQVVLGKAFLHDQALNELRKYLPTRFEFLRDVSDMSSLMSGADLALAAFGGTAYELGAMGVPSILLGLTEDHARSADALAKAGMAVSLGCYEGVTTTAIVSIVQELLIDTQRRLAMSAACLALDGGGAERVANELIKIVQR